MPRVPWVSKGRFKSPCSSHSSSSRGITSMSSRRPIKISVKAISCCKRALNEIASSVIRTTRARHCSRTQSLRGTSKLRRNSQKRSIETPQKDRPLQVLPVARRTYWRTKKRTSLAALVLSQLTKSKKLQLTGRNCQPTHSSMKSMKKNLLTHMEARTASVISPAQTSRKVRNRGASQYKSKLNKSRSLKVR